MQFSSLSRSVPSGHRRGVRQRCAAVNTDPPSISQASSSSSQRPAATSRAFGSFAEKISILASTSVLTASLLLGGPLALVSPPHATAAATAAIAQDAGQKAVEEYQELEAKGKANNANALNDIRSKYRIRRTVDGRVQIKTLKGEWISVRLDMEVPGALLMRDTKGNVYAVQTDSLQQIDLSDDYVVLMMFSDGAWEELMVPIEYSDDNGKTQQLKLDEKEFRDVVGILKETGGEDEPAGGAAGGKK